MKTGELLKSLLKIADMKQKFFAESMYASPSKISKIINGKLQVTGVEAKSFSEQAARIFADELYDNNCYYKFRDIFPIIFNFSSRFDLTDFLSSAFQYTIEQDREAAEDPGGRSFENKHYSGNKQILYMYCIILSDYLKKDRHELLEFYSALQQFFGYYAELLDKIIVLPPEMQREIIFYQFFDPEHLKSLAHEYMSDIMTKLFETELYTDLYRWEVKIDANKPFLLAKDKFIMLFDKQIDGTPQLALIRNKSELNHFYELIMNKAREARCMTYNSDTVQEYLERKEAKTENLLVDEKIRTLINAAPAGDEQDQENDPVAALYDRLLEDGTTLYMSADSLESFLFRSEIIVPSFLIVGLDLQGRIDYLNRLRKYIDSRKPVVIKLINTQLNSLSFYIDRSWSLVSLVHPLSKRIKYHIFDSELIGPALQKAASESDITVSDFVDRLIAQTRKHH